MVIAGLLALAAIASVMVAFNRTHEVPQAAPVERGTPAPSAFSLEVQPTSSPFVNRGGTVGLELSVARGPEIARVELWADGDPFIVIDDPALITTNTSGTTLLNLDYVPLVAGAHVITARAIDAEGRLAQSAPLAIPTQVLASDSGRLGSGMSEVAFDAPEMRFRSAPGDTLATIANRLGVDPGALIVTPLPASATAPIPLGSIVTGTVPNLKDLGKPTFPKVGYPTLITVEVSECVAIVRNNSDDPLRVYGGAGMAALGDVEARGELHLPSLPIGPTVLQAMKPNITAETISGSDAPTAPIVATIPDACARSGWQGAAYISGGLLLTDVAVARPYLYVSKDKGQWERVPTTDGTYLAQGAVSFADLRSFVDLGDFDQLDVEVWSGDQPVDMAAEGHFCRKDMKNASAGTSGSGGECEPPAPSHLASATPGAPVSAPFTITATPDKGLPTVSAGVIVAEDAPMGAYFTVSGSSTFTLTSTALAAGYGQVQYQVSYVPFSPASPSVNPPGLLWSKTVASTEKVTIDPWVWHNALLDGDELIVGDAVALNDEMTLAMARARLAAGLSLVDTLYIRAVAVKKLSKDSSLSLGAASKNVQITMPSITGGAWQQIANPTATIAPGRDQSATLASVGAGTLNTALNPNVTGVTDTCHEVVSYPADKTWVMYPGATPRYRTPKGDEYSGTRKSSKDTLILNGEGNTDLSFAKLAWPRQDVIYCLDYDWRAKQTADANEEYGESDCGLGCVLTFVVYGAAQGFILGGPYGALVGALAGLAVGVGSAIDANFYAEIQAAWDEIAGFYNAVFDNVWSLVSDINLLCYGIGQLGEDAQKYCDETVQAVGSAVITYYTGVPPSLATSAELQAAGDGNMEAAIILALDAGLQALGVDFDCSSFTLDESSTAALKVTAAKAGISDAEFQQATGGGKEVSACAAIAGIITKRMRIAMDARQGQIMSALTGQYAVPGQVLSPVADTQPILKLVGAPAPGTKGVQSCPVVVNGELTEGGVTQTLQAVQGAVVMRYYRAPKGQTAPPAQWVGEVPLASLVSVDDPKRNRIIESNPAVAGAPYLRVTVTSPCFAQALTVSVPKYGFFGMPSAYFKDGRPAVAYH